MQTAAFVVQGMTNRQIAHALTISERTTERQPHSDEVIRVVCPATEDDIGQAPHATEADVDDAVAAATRALTSSEWGTFGINGYNPDVGSPYGG